MKKLLPLCMGVVFLLGLTAETAWAQRVSQRAIAFVESNAAALGLTDADVRGMLVTDEYKTRHNGVTHVYLQQGYQGIGVYNALLNYVLVGSSRDAVIAILRDTPRDPVAGLAMLPVLQESMRWMLEAAGIATEGVQGQVRISGLVVIWLATLRIWMQDETADMAKTMSALDRNLRRAESLVRRSARRVPPEDA